MNAFAETSNNISDDTICQYDKDPLSDLTRNQRVVLYTLFLCREAFGFVFPYNDDVTMGDIDVRKTLEELEDRGLVKSVPEVLGSDRTLYKVTFEKLNEIIQSYTENYLLSDIDKDFFIDVAEDFPLYQWYRTQDRIINRDILIPQDRRSITLMRLLMEGRMDGVEYIIENRDDELVPDGFFSESDGFVQFWKNHCRQRSIHPTDWSNGVGDGEMGRYFSAYTILSGYEEEFLKLHLNKSKWSILILILLSERYSILSEEKLMKEKVEQIQQTFKTLNDSDEEISDNILLIQELINNDKMLTKDKEKKTLEFTSEDIRHQVMGYFVLNCLLSDEDYQNYFKLSSSDSVFDYVRTFDYKQGQEEERKNISFLLAEVEDRERCLYVPMTLEETLVRESGIDIVRHMQVKENRIQDLVSDILNIPREILNWDYEARCRYVECARKGTQTIHRARAMIVGCAGAGKTTLLKRLQKRSLHELQQIQSTIGLEVHEDIFEVSEEKNILIAVEEEDKEGKALLSVMDFGGQCAYYACHQVYLSRRAFYLLVIDMSKSFDEKVDPALCEQQGTMFADWTYGEYILFWLKSVHTYCESNAPVVIIGTHFEKVEGQNSDTFYNNILDHLQFNKHLKGHLDRKRCFVLGFHADGALSDTVILDIQWFIDSFKNIITDPNHVRDVAENRIEWLDFYISGHILDTLLTNIWRLRNFASDFWDRYQYKEHILRYMERLGLIAVGTVAHYIPCTNRRTFGRAEENHFHSLEYKTSVLVFRFDFLPYFFYFRLIVSCLTRTNREWRVLQDNGLCLYKNVACFAYKQHAVALAVNPSSIQLQVFQPTNTLVTKRVVLEVRNIITDLLNDLLQNFHKKIDMYTVGFQCSKQEVFHELDDCFVEEEELLKKGTMLCPKHELNNSHMLHESILLSYWNLDVLAESTDPDALVEKGAYRNLPEPEMRTYRFHCFEKLTKIGREALQRYFDKILPPAELFMLLQKEKNNIRRQFNKDQCDLLFPVDKSIPTSSAFDVTLIYKLLRNFGPNLPSPTKGWGKTPEPGQKSPTDDVERIRVYRNEVEHKTPATSVMEKEDCLLKWRDLCQAILRLSEGKLEQDIMDLRHQD